MKKIILAAMAFAAVVSAKAQDINAVLKSVEQNNMELKALLKGNEAADIENKSQNTLEDLSIEYSPFFQSETSGIASSELVITQGFDFPTLYGARKKAGQLQRNVLDMQYQTARRDILVNAKKLCLDIINYNKQKQLLQERRKNADELFDYEAKWKANSGWTESDPVKYNGKTWRSAYFTHSGGVTTEYFTDVDGGSVYVRIDNVEEHKDAVETMMESLEFADDIAKAKTEAMDVKLEDIEIKR